jgi:hypothetical protein
VPDPHSQGVLAYFADLDISKETCRTSRRSEIRSDTVPSPLSLPSTAV